MSVASKSQCLLGTFTDVLDLRFYLDLGRILGLPFVFAEIMRIKFVSHVLGIAKHGDSVNRGELLSMTMTNHIRYRDLTCFPFLVVIYTTFIYPSIFLFGLSVCWTDD